MRARTADLEREPGLWAVIRPALRVALYFHTGVLRFPPQRGEAGGRKHWESFRRFSRRRIGWNGVSSAGEGPGSLEGANGRIAGGVVKPRVSSWPRIFLVQRPGLE